MDADTLRELIEDDDLGLLEIKPKQASSMSEDERLVESFYEITAFYRQYGRAPENDMANVQEARLAMRLSGLRTSPEKINALIDIDDFGLLVPIHNPESIDDILNDDELNLLGDSPADSIFTLRNVPQTIDMPDYVATRKPCEDFKPFKPLFEQCQEALRAGTRKLLPFTNEQHIQQGQFFILRGVMAYIAEVGKKERKGGKECYKNGRRVSEHEDHLINELNGITDEDSQTGYIYVLKSLSTNPEIASIKDLYKIGFSTVPVEERIQHATTDPTYLMATVQIVETFECYNLNPQKMELLLHRFFGKVCLEVDVFDSAGKRHTPREWFIVPLPIIVEVIELIILGDIVNYYYNHELKILCGKS